MDFQVPKITPRRSTSTAASSSSSRSTAASATRSATRCAACCSPRSGAAVTSVKIEGVAHEFTTLKGVREDVTDIILSLKNLICRLHGDSPEIEVRLDKKGAGKVTAADIEAPADLEILNPGSRIANVSGKAASRSRADHRPRSRLRPGRAQPRTGARDRRDPGRLDLLARTCVLRGRAARVGQRTDYDKLKLDVTTDGALAPRDAIGQAAEILIRQLAIFTDLERI